MALENYDEIIDLIEENLTLDWENLRDIVVEYMHLEERDLNEFFKVINPNGNTLRQYFQYRKVCNVMQEQKAGYTQEELAEKYNFRDAAYLSREIKRHLGKNATELLREDFHFSEPQHIVDIAYENGLLNEDKKIEEKDQVIGNMKTSEEKYKTELISAIDNIVKLQTENEKLKAVIRRNDMEMDAKKRKHHNLFITLDMYETFQNIERCRVVYDFSREDIIRLYQESLETGVDLEALCIAEDDAWLLALEAEQEKYYEEEENERALEELEYITSYEGTLVERCWEYYFDDDPADCPVDHYEGDESEW